MFSSSTSADESVSERLTIAVMRKNKSLAHRRNRSLQYSIQGHRMKGTYRGDGPQRLTIRFRGRKPIRKTLPPSATKPQPFEIG